MASIRFGRRPFGRAWLFGGNRASGSGSGAGGGETAVTTARPGEYSVKVYNADGTKLAEWGSSVGNNPVLALNFELLQTGCGSFEMRIGELPATATLNHGMRLDIHLFGDVAPWYSGYITERPVAGTTARPYTFNGYGFFQQLDWVLVTSTYTNMDIATVVKSILQNVVEPDTQINYQSNKVINVGYMATKLRFENVTAKEALKQLSAFATGYVYGVDERRDFFFRPIRATINEQARLFVGVHVSEYNPTEDLNDLVNYAVINGSTLDESGSNVLAVAQSLASQAVYGLRKKVLDIPAAVGTADAARWGAAEIDRLKDPVKRATIKGLKLEYPNANGSFNVRRIRPDGRAAVTPIEGGPAHEYPITKIKYTLAGGASWIADLTLGEPDRSYADWYVLAVRDKKNADFIQSANNVQLSGGNL